MQIFEKEISVDISAESEYKSIDAKQGDYNSRYLRISILSNGEKYSLDENDIVALRCTHDEDIFDMSIGTVNNDGTVSLEVPKTILARSGSALCDISISSGEESLISSSAFLLNIYKSPLTGDVVADDGLLSPSELFVLLKECVYLKHSHLNKTELDNFKSGDAAKIHNHNNKDTLDLFGEETIAGKKRLYYVESGTAKSYLAKTSELPVSMDKTDVSNIINGNYQSYATKHLGAVGLKYLYDLYINGNEIPPNHEAVINQKINASVNTALAEAKESGEFDGAKGEKGDKGAAGTDGVDGKSAYEYAVEGGFSGSEEEFSEKLASDSYTGVGIKSMIIPNDYDKGVISFSALNANDSVIITNQLPENAKILAVTFINAVDEECTENEERLINNYEGILIPATTPFPDNDLYVLTDGMIIAVIRNDTTTFVGYPKFKVYYTAVSEESDVT